MDWDLGDVVASFNLRVKGRQRHGIRLRNGVPEPTTPEERSSASGHAHAAQEGKGPIVDLAADHKIPVSVQWTDEVGNPTGAPLDASVTYTSSDTSVLTVNDFGDGTAEAVATGTLGSAVLSVSASADGETLTGEETVNVVAGLAERVSIAFGEPTEVTPDDV